MRWEYESPEAKLFVSDGKTVWFYVPADRTVIRTPVKESADWRMPFALLTREPKLSRICSQIVLGRKEEALEVGYAVLRCTPKGSARDFREILIEIDEKNGDVGRVLVREAGGVEIDFRFAGWKRNVPVAESQFRFTAPPGVAIVHGGAAQQGGN
jgi:outer membrane lipoprotein carrier protein